MERDREELVQVLSDFADYLDQQVVQPAVEELTAAAERIDTEKPKRKAEFWGEYIRESAVLVLVFIPIDLLIPRLLDPQKALSYWWAWFLGTLAFSLALLLLGIAVERS
jgi:hypothetical protein